MLSNAARGDHPAGAMFWQPLAEDQDRPMTVEVVPGPVLVRASAEGLAACTDILLENVFSHTAEGLGRSRSG